MQSRIDLTPFGFTSTESLVYGALLGLGMSSGYAVGKELSLARANVYQALHGLVAKGAAERSEETPQRFEAVTPSTLLAQLTHAQAEHLDRLERQLRGARETGGRGLVPITSRRSLLDLALRTGARSSGLVIALADPDTLRAMAPIWRKRASDQADTRIWSIGSDIPDLPQPVSGVIESAQVRRAFGTAPVTIVVAAEAAILAKSSGPECEGHWTSHPLLVAAVRAGLLHLTVA